MKRILFLMAMGLLIGTASACANNDKAPEESKEEQQEVKPEEKNQQEVEKGNSEVKEEDKKSVTDIQIETKDDTTTGTLYLDKDVSDEEARELVQKYVDELKKENKDSKGIDVQAIREGQYVTEISVLPINPSESEDASEDTNLPTATLLAKRGVILGTKEVYVTLDTDQDEQYVVTVEDKELTYVPDKDQFISVVETTKDSEDLKVTVTAK